MRVRLISAWGVLAGDQVKDSHVVIARTEDIYNSLIRGSQIKSDELERKVTGRKHIDTTHWLV